MEGGILWTPEGRELFERPEATREVEGSRGGVASVGSPLAQGLHLKVLDALGERLVLHVRDEAPADAAPLISGQMPIT